jgi:hypothetical protein
VRRQRPRSQVRHRQGDTPLGIDHAVDGEAHIPHLDGPAGGWFKASKSANDNSCVEMREDKDGMMRVRDSKNKNGASLSFTSAEWQAWLNGAKNGEFDHLA